MDHSPLVYVTFQSILSFKKIVFGQFMANLRIARSCPVGQTNIHPKKEVALTDRGKVSIL